MIRGKVIGKRSLVLSPRRCEDKFLVADDSGDPVV
jgi:hypothetical protein